MFSVAFSLNAPLYFLHGKEILLQAIVCFQTESGFPPGILYTFLLLSHLLLFTSLPGPAAVKHTHIIFVTVAEMLLPFLCIYLVCSYLCCYFTFFKRFSTVWVFCSWLFAFINFLSTPNAELCQADHRVTIIRVFFPFSSKDLRVDFFEFNFSVF